MTAPARVPLVVDTDGGIDDAVALWWAATAPDVELLAVTAVHGNVDVRTAAANALRVLDAAGRTDVPVVVGEAVPAGDVPSLRVADFIHGRDGLGDTGRPPPTRVPADATLEEVARSTVVARPGEVAVVTLGPLSNLARLVRDVPGFATSCRRLVVMGGAVTVQGNALPLAEANIAHDPVAARAVVEASWSTPPLLVGLDVTHCATLTSAEVALLAERRTPAAEYLDDPLRFYARFAGTFCEPGEFPCHDLLATIAAVRPIVHGPVLPLSVQAEPGPAWGATVADRRLPYFERAGAGAAQASPPGFSPWEVGLDVDVEAFRSEVRAMFGGQPSSSDAAVGTDGRHDGTSSSSSRAR